MAQPIQLLVVNWSAAVGWAGLRHLVWGQNFVVPWDSADHREGADLPTRHLLLVHLHRLSNQVDGGLHVSQLVGLSVEQTEDTAGHRTDLIGHAGQGLGGEVFSLLQRLQTVVT